MTQMTNAHASHRRQTHIPLLAASLRAALRALCPQIPPVQKFKAPLRPFVSVRQEGPSEREWHPWNHYNNPSPPFFFFFSMLHAPIYIFGWHAWLVCLISVNCSAAQFTHVSYAFAIFYYWPSGSTVTKRISRRRRQNVCGRERNKAALSGRGELKNLKKSCGNLTHSISVEQKHA